LNEHIILHCLRFVVSGVASGECGLGEGLREHVGGVLGRGVLQGVLEDVSIVLLDGVVYKINNLVK
jgi:hypothetical protein